MDAERGDRLREIRKALGLTQKAFAKEIGLSERGWQELERGANPPSGETLLKIAALGFGPTWVLTGKGPKSLAGERDQQGQELVAPAAEVAKFTMAVLKQVRIVVSRTYKDEGVKLVPDAISDESERRTQELLGRLDRIGDLDEASSLLPWLETRIRRELQENRAAGLGTGKREAS